MNEQTRTDALMQVHDSNLKVAAAIRTLSVAFARSMRRQSRLVFVWLSLISVALMVLTYNSFVNRSLAETNREAAEVVRDCTVAERHAKCYTDAQASQAAAIGLILSEIQRIVDQALCDAGVYCTPGSQPRPKASTP